MARCPDNILASAQAAANGGRYGYSEVPADQFNPYDGRGVPGPRHSGIYVLESGQRFLFLDARDMYEGGREREAMVDTEVHVLHYGHGGYLPGEVERGFWRITGFRLPNGQCYHLSET